MGYWHDYHRSQVAFFGPMSAKSRKTQFYLENACYVIIRFQEKENFKRGTHWLNGKTRSERDVVITRANTK